MLLKVLKEKSTNTMLPLVEEKAELKSLNLWGKVAISMIGDVPYFSVEEVRGLIKTPIKKVNLDTIPGGQTSIAALKCNKDSDIESDGLMMKNDEKHLIKGYISRTSANKDKPFLLQIFDVYKEMGKRKRKLLYSQYFRTEEDAYEEKTSQHERLHKGLDLDDISAEGGQRSALTKKTVEEYTLYLLNRGVKRAETETLEGYRYSAKPLLKVDMGAGRGCFGSLKLKNVTDDDVMFAFRKLSGIQAQSSLQKTFFVGKMVFSEAAQKGHINLNCPRIYRQYKKESLW